MWQIIRPILGVTLIILGAIGMLLPIMPGIPILIAGVALLGANHPWVRPFMVRFRAWRRARKRPR
ncbi:MAG TPA: hypothetical protein VLT62_04460 [Candidatus Methylomirabilis sp.]|nr:hypothetical protein [Candidatus Methylomirabilis sp.]